MVDMLGLRPACAGLWRLFAPVQCRITVERDLRRKEEGSVPCPGQPELAYMAWHTSFLIRAKSSALVTGFVLAEGTHQDLM